MFSMKGQRVKELSSESTVVLTVNVPITVKIKIFVVVRIRVGLQERQSEPPVVLTVDIAVTIGIAEEAEEVVRFLGPKLIVCRHRAAADQR